MKSLPGILLICYALVLLTGCSDNDGKARAGTIAKDFRLDTLSHDRFYLNQQRGKVVVLIFWTTWCNICKEEMVELKTLKETSGSRGLVVAAICTDPENSSDMKRIVEDLKVDYPVLLDRNARVSGEYGIPGFPTTIVIDQKGVISLVREGYDPVVAEHLRNKVSTLLASEASAN